jgi:hypothetical protein
MKNENTVAVCLVVTEAEAQKPVDRACFLIL